MAAWLMLMVSRLTVLHPQARHRGVYQVVRMSVCLSVSPAASAPGRAAAALMKGRASRLRPRLGDAPVQSEQRSVAGQSPPNTAQWWEAPDWRLWAEVSTRRVRGSNRLTLSNTPALGRSVVAPF